MLVVVDERERASGVPDELEFLGARVEYRVLDVADYLTGDYSVERKSVRDFIGSSSTGDFSTKPTGSVDPMTMFC